jgi:phage gpG-like protein
MTITMQMVGFDILKANMAKRQARLNQRRAVNARAVTVVDRWIQKNFQSQGGNVGGWKPLAEATKTPKRGGDSAKILQDTGTMRAKWNHIATSKEAKIVSGVDYSIYHNEGKGVPERRILPTNAEIWPALKKVYGNFIKDSLK